MLSIHDIRRAMAGYEPRFRGDASQEISHAAVAMVLREREGVPEVLLIERAEREGDPWSGHMAFPGGRIDPGEPDARSAAVRETFEEVGVDLLGAEPLGRLDDLEGRRAAGASGMIISAFVYHHRDPSPLAPNHEVREAFWFPVSALLDPERRVHHPWRPEGPTAPGILVGEPGRHVVWGLTYRFLEVFFEALGRPLPNRWSDPTQREETD